MVKIRRGDGTAVPDRAPAERSGRRMKEVDVSAVVREYAGGKSIRTLATERGVSYGTMHQRLTAAGVEMRERGDWRKARGAGNS